MREPPEGTGAARPRVLVLEDDAIQALDIVDALEEAGLAAVGPFGRADDALGALAVRPDAAVIDWRLAGGDAVAVADRLDALGIPYAVVTGFADGGSAAGRGAPVLEKPFSRADLAAAVLSLLADARR